MIILIGIGILIVAGGICLWGSGYCVAKTTAVQPEVLAGISAENRRLKKAVDELMEEQRAARATAQNHQGRDADGDTAKDEEIARLSSKLAQKEGETDKALLEIDNLKEDLQALKNKKTENLPRPHVPTGPIVQGESLDELQAQIDMEKVAHQKTRDELDKATRELEQVKKIAAARMASSLPGVGPSAASDVKEDTQGRFRTMAIGLKSPASQGGEIDSGQVLRTALNKAQTEKARVEAELERTRKELQLMRMRGDS